MIKNILLSNISEFEMKIIQVKNKIKNRDIVIVEGELSKLGNVKNFTNTAKSIKRLLCPYIISNKIYNKLIKVFQKENRNLLVIISLNEITSILAKDLNIMGYETISIISTEYKIQNVKDVGIITKNIINKKESEEFCQNTYINEVTELIY